MTKKALIAYIQKDLKRIYMERKTLSKKKSSHKQEHLKVYLTTRQHVLNECLNLLKS